jgi:hypothetical protein
MWLWVDSGDTLQWGSHTITADAGGASITAIITSTSVTYDPGDGAAPVTCLNPGTPRPWNPTDLLEHHSPSGCEYTYLTTSELGNRDSRFTVTATVTWDVTWTTTTGESGRFTLTLASDTTTSIHVGELRAVTVPNPPH